MLYRQLPEHLRLISRVKEELYYVLVVRLHDTQCHYTELSYQ